MNIDRTFSLLKFFFSQWFFNISLKNGGKSNHYCAAAVEATAPGSLPRTWKEKKNEKDFIERRVCFSAICKNASKLEDRS